MYRKYKQLNNDPFKTFGFCFIAGKNWHPYLIDLALLINN